jgi:hypothetical protein
MRFWTFLLEVKFGEDWKMVVLDLEKGLEEGVLDNFEWVFWDWVTIKGNGYRFSLGERILGLEEIRSELV